MILQVRGGGVVQHWTWQELFRNSFPHVFFFPWIISPLKRKTLHGNFNLRKKKTLSFTWFVMSYFWTPKLNHTWWDCCACKISGRWEPLLLSLHVAWDQQFFPVWLGRFGKYHIFHIIYHGYIRNAQVKVFSIHDNIKHVYMLIRESCPICLE